MGPVMNDKTLKEIIKEFKAVNHGIAMGSGQESVDIELTNTRLKCDKQVTKGRVSKNQSTFTPAMRRRVIEQVMKSLLYSQISHGDALKQLRCNVLGSKQADYAKLVKISRKTLSEIENDKSGPSVDIINKAFKPFGLKVGLVPMSPNMLNSLFRLDNQNQAI